MQLEISGFPAASQGSVNMITNLSSIERGLLLTLGVSETMYRRRLLFEWMLRRYRQLQMSPAECGRETQARQCFLA
jgi:hypothetical protein